MNPVYPHCDFTARTVRIGGMGKPELMEALESKGIGLNEAARILFAHPGFTTSATETCVEAIEIRVADLGWTQGATFSALVEKAGSLGLSPCPLELGPRLRLQLPEGEESRDGDLPSRHSRHSPHKAPPGSLTVISRRIVPDEGFPQGFYLRRIEGVPWLRGYWSGADHVWDPQDRLLFLRGGGGPGDFGTPPP
jgi:hypothetical protein